jgi:hypothetical protein
MTEAPHRPDPNPGIQARESVGGITCSPQPAGEPSTVTRDRAYLEDPAVAFWIVQEGERVPVAARPLGSSHPSVARPRDDSDHCRAAPIYPSSNGRSMADRFSSKNIHFPLLLGIAPRTLAPGLLSLQINSPRRAMHQGCVARANESGGSSGVVADITKLSVGREAYYTRELATDHEQYLSGHGESPGRARLRRGPAADQERVDPLRPGRPGHRPGGLGGPPCRRG